MINILVPEKDLNRKERRALQREFEQVATPLAKIEQEFVDVLFKGEYYMQDGEDTVVVKFSYKHLYQKYLNKWREQIKSDIRNQRYKYTTPDEGYFARTYRPVEQG